MSTEKPMTPPLRSFAGGGRVSAWLIGIVSFGVLLFLFVQLTSEAMKPPIPLFSLQEDIPLPAVLPPKYLPDAKNIPAHLDPLTPGVSLRFDHFDFQSLDPKTGLLFIAHTGPAPDKVPSIDTRLNNVNPDDIAPIDGHILVFDTRHNKVLTRLDIPQVAGVVAAPDLGRVFAADSNDSIVYSINERDLQHPTKIQLDDLEGPDAIEYDPDDQKIFVSDPGVPPDTSPNIDLKNQNLSVIDTRTNQVTKINLGHLPKLPNEHADLVQWGYDVGHNKYDPGLHRIFVTTQQLTDQSPLVPLVSPAGTGELVSVNPTTEKVDNRLALPSYCGTPHGMNIDVQQQIAFIACGDVDSAQNLVPHLVRVDLQAWKVLPDSSLLLPFKPDIVILDHSAHALFVACASTVAVFDIQGRTIHSAGNQFLGKGTHTLAIDEKTQLVYLPLPDAGGMPILRIARYNPHNGFTNQ